MCLIPTAADGAVERNPCVETFTFQREHGDLRREHDATRFLQLKEQASGLRFDQPVLDTLLLSAWLHPNQESHRLEAIAERLGVAITGRHTALGDACVTAEVFLRLIPLLRAKDVRTLGEARAAALQTYQARLKY